MVKLTPKFITTEVPDEKCDSIQKLALPGREIEKVLVIVSLRTCTRSAATADS